MIHVSVTWSYVWTDVRAVNSFEMVMLLNALGWCQIFLYGGVHIN